MIRILLFRFWPVFIPFILYLLWWNLRGKRLREDGLLDAAKHRRILGWTALSAVTIGIVLALVLLSAIEGQDGAYVPPHMENGALVGGHFEPVEKKAP